MVDDANNPTWTALNGDVVGYSRLVADDVERTSATLEEYRNLVSRVVEAATGRVANFAGDNFMAVFPNTEAAVRTAIGLSTAIEARNHDLPDAAKIRFRMGLDEGSVTVSEGHHHGEALNISARIQAMAQPGGVSVSGRVYRALDEPALRFHPRGVHRLKNIPEPVEVYDFADLPADGDRPSTPSLLSLEMPTVAVLPIHVEDLDRSLHGSAEVVRGDLLHRLSTIPELKVIDARMTAGSVPEERARYLLETGMHQFGDTLRAYAVIFDVTTMNVVTSHKRTVHRSELLDASEQLSEGVARAMEVDLIVGAPAGLYSDLDDPVAIQQVYQGWFHLRSGSRVGWEQALKLFRTVGATHPTLPYGDGLTAFALWAGVDNGWAATPSRTLAEAETLARRADELGDPTGMSKAVRAAILMSRGEAKRAMATLKEVEILRPTCDVTYALEGSVRRYMGEWEQAVDLLDVAMRLTGVNKPWYPTVKACSLFIGDRPAEAATLAESVLEYQPDNLEALLVLAASQWEQGLERRAGSTADRIRDRFPTLDVAAWLERSPYTDPGIVERWRSDLSALGLIA
jgi:adenylate cyclase